MLSTLVVTQMLLEISEEHNFLVTPKRRDQREPGDRRCFVVLHQISGSGTHTLAGDAGMDFDRIQIDVAGLVLSDCHRVVRAIRRHIRTRRGPVEIPGFGTYFLCDCQYGGIRDLYSPPVDGSEQGDYVLSLDLILTLSGVTNE
jgi:hypothetical protein